MATSEVMDTFQALYGRRSIRNFEPGKPIPQEVLQRILSSAWYTLPLPGGQLPWRLVAVRDQTTKNMLADSAKEVAMLMFGASFEIFGPGHLWYLPKDTQLAVAEYTTTGELWEYPRDADVVLMPLFTKMAWVDTISTMTTSIDLYLQFLGFATQNMWLVAYKYGIGAGYNGMPLLDIRRRETMAMHLGIPWSWEPTGAFSLGYATGPRYFGPARPPLEGVTFSEYWGNPYRRMALEETSYEKMELPETEIEDVIQNLNFVDSFGDRPVPRWKIEKVLDAAIYGPVPENFKNWRFLVVKDKQSKEFLKTLASEKKHCPWTFNWPELQYSRMQHLPQEDRLAEVERVMEKGLGGWLTEADTLIIVLTCVFNWRDQPYPGVAAMPIDMWSISTGACVQSMMIAASALGLGVNYDLNGTADERTRELMTDYFGIPAGTWVPLGILGLGEPGEKAVLPVKPPLQSLIYDEYWGNPYPQITV